MSDFLASETRKEQYSRHGNRRHIQKFVPKPLPKKKPKFKDIYKKVKQLQESLTFEQWLENLQGPMSHGIRKHATEWYRVHQSTSPLTRVQLFTMIAFIIAAWPVAAADPVVSLVVPERNSRKIATNIGVAQLPRIDDVPRMSAHNSRKLTGSQRRKQQKIERNKRLKTMLSDISAQRDRRLPVSALDSLSESKWLSYMLGTLRDDDQYLESEIEAVKDLLVQVYDLVDADADGPGDGHTKRKYMAPILEPIIYDLTVEALKADWAFVNATFHGKIYGDRSSKQMQKQRARKVALKLFAEANVAYRASVVDQIVMTVNQDPEKWHESVPVPLGGHEIVTFLRKKTKDYVYDALKALS